jgi:hypothetical protein
MKQPERKQRIGRPSPAMVVAMIALIVALTGSAYAFTVPRNSVGPRQLQAKAVTNGKIAEGAITGAKIAEATITGQNINMAALGTVPASAASANAAEAQKLDKHEALCPQGTTLIRGVCFDDHSNPPIEGVEAAAERCTAKGGYLPTPMELYSAKGMLNLGTGVGAEQHQFTDALYGTVGSGNLEKTVVVDGVGAPEEFEANGESSYYCVYPLVR